MMGFQSDVTQIQLKPDPSLQSAIGELANHLPESATNWWVAFSGGLDSCVLLQQLAIYCQQKPTIRLKAIHVHHGLSHNADRWVTHCRDLCQTLGVELTVKQVAVAEQSRRGLEQRAREVRWQTLFETVPAGQVIWLGHHLDDQAETLMLKLLRGSGVLGASAMQPSSTRQHRYLLRPLLAFPKSYLSQLAQQAGIRWVEDESNGDTRFSRNYLRHQVLPVIETKWRGYRQSLSRFAEHMQQSQRLMQQLAELDWQRVGRDSAIVIAELRKLNPDRQVNLLRYWMQQQAHYLPNAKALQQLLSQLAEAKTDSRIRLDWGDWRVEQSAELLYFVPADDVEPFQYHWQSFPAPLHLKPLALALQVQALSNESLKKGHLGVRPPNADEQVVVRSRRGGEKCWPDYRERATELKKVFQELNLPRWQRDRVPLVFYNDQLVAAVGLFCDRRFASKSTDAIVFELTKASHHR